MLPPEINHGKPWKYAQQEFERRFLISQRPETLSHAKYKEIEDKYLDETRIRVRRVKNDQLIQYKLTKMLELGQPDAPIHWISTIYLSQPEFAIFQKLPGVAYQKRRYYLDDESGNTIGVDEINLSQGTIWIAEVEFDNAEEMNGYQFPLEYDREISGEAAFSGYELAKGMSNG